MNLDLPETHVAYILQVLQERPYRECQPTIDLIAKAIANGQKPLAVDSLAGTIPVVKIPGAGNGNSNGGTAHNSVAGLSDPIDADLDGRGYNL